MQCQKPRSPLVAPSGTFLELGNSLEEFLWDINTLHPLSRTRFRPQALQKSSRMAFCGHAVKITALFCIQSGYLQGHVFCSSVDLGPG